MSEFSDNAKDVLGAVKDDIAAIPTVGEKLVAGTLATGLVAHELGNSAYLGMVGANVYALTNSIPLTVLSMYLASLSAEAALSTGVAAHLSDFEHTSAVLAKIHANRSGLNVRARSSKVDRAIRRYNAVMLAVGLGAAGTVTDEFARNPNADRRALMRRGLRVSRRLAVWNGAVGLAISGGVRVAEKTGHEQLAEGAVHLFRNPLLYLGVIATGVAARGAHRWHATRVTRRHQAEIPQPRAPEDDAPARQEDEADES
jgi:hypothetical protein